MARTYEVILEIGADDLEELRHRGYAPACAKPPGSAVPKVVCFSVPLARRTVLAWAEDRYGIYASRVAAGTEGAIRIDEEVFPAAAQSTYELEGTGFRAAAGAPNIPRGRYQLTNRGTAAITAGLVQEASVDGAVTRTPLNAVVLPPGFTAEFATATRLYVWLQQPVASGTTISAPAENAVEIALDARRSIAYRYDRESGRFVPVRG